ncbi:unnamed protein product [Callosobruchus maculatus]|uniref:Uncharacterized protein n=1 Tax=Callosobruchus maculatus TaxID=64391 RepID=A0A653BJJ3_CALMS|nr:unnamed protein product [Callosobruchus maculatus]
MRIRKSFSISTSPQVVPTTFNSDSSEVPFCPLLRSPAMLS